MGRENMIKIIALAIAVLLIFTGTAIATTEEENMDETIGSTRDIHPAYREILEITSKIIPAIDGPSLVGDYNYYVTKEFDQFPGNNWVNAVRIAAQTDNTVVYIDINCDDIADIELELEEGDNWEEDLPTGTHIVSNNELTVHQYDDSSADWEMVILPELRFWDRDYYYGGIWSYGSGSNNHILIQAANDNTFVEIDFDNDGVVDLSNIINRCEVWDLSQPAVYDATEDASYDSRVGAHITSDEVIQVHAFAEHAAAFGSAYNIIPTSSLGYEYFVPYITTTDPVGWDESDNIVVVATKDNTLVGIDANHDSIIDVTKLLVKAGDNWAYPLGTALPGWSHGAWVASIIIDPDTGNYLVDQEKAIVVFHASPRGGHQWDGFMAQMVPKLSTRPDYWNTVSWETLKYSSDLSQGIWPGAPYLYLFAYEDNTIVYRDVDNDGIEDFTYTLNRKDGGLTITPEKCGEHYWIDDPDNHHVSMYQGWYVDAGDALSPVSYEINPLQVTITVSLDVKPGSCPNPINIKSNGVLPVAILGTEDFNVDTIDIELVQLSLVGIEGGVSPIQWNYEDVATPFYPVEEGPCCHDLNGDGYMDLTLKFDTPELVETLELEDYKGETIQIIVTGNLLEEFGGTPINGEDCVRIQ